MKGTGINHLKSIELKSVVEKANSIFKKIREKYSTLSGYLVFSTMAGQCELTTDIKTILTEFPEMIIDSRQKEESRDLLQILASLETDKEKGGAIKMKIEKARREFLQRVDMLELEENTFVEIRFRNTELDLIYELQRDECVSQTYTPQTKASIRIVLGTIGELR